MGKADKVETVNDKGSGTVCSLLSPSRERNKIEFNITISQYLRSNGCELGLLKRPPKQQEESVWRPIYIHTTKQ